jgi:hypothetical protein
MALEGETNYCCDGLGFRALGIIWLPIGSTHSSNFALYMGRILTELSAQYYQTYPRSTGHCLMRHAGCLIHTHAWLAIQQLMTCMDAMFTITAGRKIELVSRFGAAEGAEQRRRNSDRLNE